MKEISKREKKKTDFVKEVEKNLLSDEKQVCDYSSSLVSPDSQAENMLTRYKCTHPHKDSNTSGALGSRHSRSALDALRHPEKLHSNPSPAPSSFTHVHHDSWHPS